MFDVQMNTKGAMSFDQLMGNQQQVQSQPTNYEQPVNTNTQQQVQQVSYSQPVQQRASQRQFGNGVSLVKGQKTSLTKLNQNLNNIEVCLGWDVKNQVLDLDTEVFMLGANGKVINDDWFVFYNKTSSPDGSVIHIGDSRDGAGSGDDEIIKISLSRVSSQVDKMVVIVTINEALENGYNFSMVDNAYIRIIDKSTNNELVKFMLSEYYQNVTSMIVGELYRRNNEWRFNAVGDGVSKDLAGLCTMYGVNLA